MNGTFFEMKNITIWRSWMQQKSIYTQRAYKLRHGLATAHQFLHTCLYIYMILQRIQTKVIVYFMFWVADVCATSSWMKTNAIILQRWITIPKVMLLPPICTLLWFVIFFSFFFLLETSSSIQHGRQRRKYIKQKSSEWKEKKKKKKQEMHNTILLLNDALTMRFCFIH